MTTAKELREQLARIPDDVKIILQADDEGNGYRYINGIDFKTENCDTANYFDGNYGGECHRKNDLEEGQEEGMTLVAVIY